MNLKEWRKSVRVSRACLAEMISARIDRKVAQSTVQGWENGVMPPADAFAAIQKITAGQVRVEAFKKPQPNVGKLCV